MNKEQFIVLDEKRISIHCDEEFVRGNQTQGGGMMGGPMAVLILWLYGWAVYGGFVYGSALGWVNVWTIGILLILTFVDRTKKRESDFTGLTEAENEQLNKEVRGWLKKKDRQNGN